MHRVVPAPALVRLLVLLPLLSLPAALAGQAGPAAPPGIVAAANAPAVIGPNDNREAGGRLRGGVLTVRLEARSGVWYPEGPNGFPVPVAAWGEEGQPLRNPGPLLRVPAGTEIRAMVRNSLDRPLAVYGLDEKRDMSGPGVTLAPGQARVFRFRAAAPGTYFYAGKTDTVPVFGRAEFDSQLNGAIVVDPPAPARPPADRIFVISIWGTLDPASPTGLGRTTMAINGLSWPHTERIQATQGDSLHWRVINASFLPHPMHLHGFYFRVDREGTWAHDSAFTREQRRMAVTEIVDPGHTMAITWSPSRPGNWIFHCHFAGHLSPLVALDTDHGVPGTEAMHMRHGSDAPHQMAGLVLGIHVAPNGTLAKAAPTYRPLRLLVRSKPNVYGDHVGYSYVLGGTPEEARPEAFVVPGPLLVLRKGEPVAVTIVNQSHEAAAVHWHGIELESYPDGVPGWSGWEKSILPAIPPHDSLTVHFTPPRAGTFMYHSHYNEMQQISSGLYGPIVVLEPGQRFDPETDRILVFSEGGPTTNVVSGPFAPLVLNGSATPAPLELRAGTTYRLRLIDIQSDVGNQLDLLDGDKPVKWRLLAKDGRDVPAAQATLRPASLRSAPGEIYDFELTPKAAGELSLQFGVDFPGGPPPTRVPVHVR
ncbi:MAG TPA: multicopper oxidase domain-containing protein [Longimicrobiales bacterium]|nr:multicopper oxidase domain-containing protein [Longimicrobiales bacterium]